MGLVFSRQELAASSRRRSPTSYKSTSIRRRQPAVADDILLAHSDVSVDKPSHTHIDLSADDNTSLLYKPVSDLSALSSAALIEKTQPNKQSILTTYRDNLSKIQTNIRPTPSQPIQILTRKEQIERREQSARSSVQTHIPRAIIESTFHKTELIEKLNIGIEIEGCISENVKEPILENFYSTVDQSIICAENEKKVEFILKTFVESHQIDSISEDINKIYKSFESPFFGSNKNSCVKQCGVHFHISCNSILKDKFGLLFLINLIIQWHDSFESAFINKYPYQNRVEPESAYNTQIHKLIDRKTLDIFKHQIIDVIQQRHLKSETINEIYERFVNTFSKPSIITVVKDTTYIHVEYRGLTSRKIEGQSVQTDIRTIDGIRSYIQDIERMYQQVANQTKAEILKFFKQGGHYQNEWFNHCY